MKSIARKDFVVVGTVVKSHGTQGDVKITTQPGTKFDQWAFLEIREKPVPFYILAKNQTQPTEWIIALDGINNLNLGSDLVGLNVLLPRNKAAKVAKRADFNLNGFKLEDKAIGFIGVVHGVEELPQQTMLLVNHQNKEVMIPLVEDFIARVDEKKEIIYLNLPDGFLDL